MHLPILLLLLSITLPAHAQQVYKCAKGKDVAYQSRPCDPSQQTVRQWEATPDPVALVSEPGPAAKPARKSASTSKPRSPARANRNARPRTDPADARCNAAEARRDARLKAVGLKRTFDLLRKLDDAVNEACK